MSSEDVSFMVKVLVDYKYGGALPRENLKDPDPETYYNKIDLDYGY